jgi:hypothetical protein
MRRGTGAKLPGEKRCGGKFLRDKPGPNLGKTGFFFVGKKYKVILAGQNF